MKNDLLLKVSEKIKDNNMDCYVLESKDEVIPLLKKLMKEGETVSTGGSISLADCGVYEHLKSGRYNFLDRNVEGLTNDEIEQIYRKSFFADTYLTSSNAITEDGILYNVDGRSNRVAAIAYGPASVIMVVGKNKIVKNLEAAANRVKEIAAPMNTKRLEIPSYCSKKDKCMSLLQNNSEICSGCNSDTRICCSYLISARQRQKGRIKVILVNENLGY